MDYTVLVLVFALGLRHGLDADHLAAIDGLSRLRPNRLNGVLFGLGHGLVVTVLAVGVGGLLGKTDLSWLSPYLFILIGLLNVYRLFKPAKHQHLPLQFGPLVLGAILAVGFETSSQLSALALSNQVGAWALGLSFTLGMVCTDGLDGYLATRIQQAGTRRSEQSSRLMGYMVVLVSFGYAFASLLGVELEKVSLPLGLTLLVFLVGLRLWSLRGSEANLAGS